MLAERPARTMKAFGVLLVSVFLLAMPAEAASQLYVAPDGSDDNRGSKGQPLRTLHEAQQRVREKAKGGLESDVKVILRGGTYRLAKPLHLDERDSGSAQHSITYTAYDDEEVVVSGGTQLTDWKKGHGELWVARVPEGIKPDFRELYVGGRRAVRARTPDGAMIPLRGADMPGRGKEASISVSPDCIGAWKNKDGVEVLINANWAINWKPVAAVEDSGRVTLGSPSIKGPRYNIPRKGRWCFFENAMSMLTQPGEWYLDSESRKVYYWPREGESMEEDPAVAPRLTHLLTVEGSKGTPVRNVHFQNIRFLHAGWKLPTAGYRGIQACHYIDPVARKGGTDYAIPSAITFRHARGCSIESCQMAHLGASGVRLAHGCRENSLTGNRVFDISGNGIMVGLSTERQAKLVPVGTTVHNNRVYDCGREFWGAIGIWVGFAKKVSVTHNLVRDLPYGGISVGWEWNPSPKPCKDHTVAYNHIHHVLKRLADSGGIYTLGYQPGTELTGNYIHHVLRGPYAMGSPNNGFFLDQGSKGFLIKENITYSTSADAVRFNQCEHSWHTWKNNMFNLPPLTDPPAGSALVCTGEDDSGIEVEHSDELEPKELTLESWVKFGGFPAGDRGRQWIVSKNKSEWHLGHYALVLRGSSVGAYINTGGGQENSHQVWSGRGTLDAGTWHHLAMTYDGSRVTVYVDGRKVASRPVKGKREPGDGSFVIGKRADGYSHLRGVVDEVRLFRAALPQKAIAYHHSHPGKVKSSVRAALVRQWSFEKGTNMGQSYREIMNRAGPTD